MKVSRRALLVAGAGALAGCSLPARRSAVGTGVWTSGPPAPSARSEVGGAAIGRTIYVAGGLGRDNRGDFTSDALEVYDVATNRWTVRSPLLEPVHHPGVCALDGLLYLVGGYAPDWSPVSNAARYDPAQDRWEALPPLPTARGALVAVAADGLVWAVGGRAAGDLPAVEAFDPRSGRWERRQAMPTPRDHQAAAAIDGVLYVVGGRLDGRGNLDVLEAYDITNDRWSTLAPLLTPRSGIAAAVLDGAFWVVGGEGDRIFGEVESFNPSSGVWTRQPDLPTPRHGLAAAAVDGALYVLAGGPQPGYFVSDVVEVFHPAGQARAYLPIVGS
ncbi:MAG: kelch repeat-containing protein [Dehalococcoidia bacterium]